MDPLCRRENQQSLPIPPPSCFALPKSHPAPHSEGCSSTHTILNDLSEHEFSGGFCHSAFPPFAIRLLFCVGGEGAAIYYMLHLGEPHPWAQVVSIFYEENRLAFQGLKAPNYIPKIVRPLEVPMKS